MIIGLVIELLFVTAAVLAMWGLVLLISAWPVTTLAGILLLSFTVTKVMERRQRKSLPKNPVRIR